MQFVLIYKDNRTMIIQVGSLFAWRC